MGGFGRSGGGCVQLGAKHLEFLHSTKMKSFQRHNPLSQREISISNNRAALAQEIVLFSTRKDSD